jgi:hypothetical protein
VSRILLESGRCRYCGCTDTAGCLLDDGKVCRWITSSRTVCSAESCVTWYKRDLLAAIYFSLGNLRKLRKKMEGAA